MNEKIEELQRITDKLPVGGRLNMIRIHVDKVRYLLSILSEKEAQLEAQKTHSIDLGKKLFHIINKKLVLEAKVEEVRNRWNELSIEFKNDPSLCLQLGDDAFRDIENLISLLAEKDKKIERLEILLAEAQQWIDSDPDWKVKYMDRYMSLLKLNMKLDKKRTLAEARIRELEGEVRK